MVYVEFLEALCRLSLQLFNKSELEYVSCAKKLAEILKNLLKLVGLNYNEAEEEHEPYYSGSSGNTTQTEEELE